ncbi:proteasome subunit beta type-4 [Haemaphysalis longicornis]
MAFDMSVLPGEASFGFSKFHPTIPATMFNGTRQRTQSPMTTATSVLGIKFNGGVMIAADTLGSYGSLARFRDCPRILRVNDQIAATASGDYADFQFLKSVIEQKMITEECLHDGFRLKPKSLYSWLTRVMYNRRSKFDPLWNTYIIAGLQDGVPFLGQVDMLGMAFESTTLATGYGAYIAQPLLRDAYEKKAGQLTKEEAHKLLAGCLEVLYYRDARSFDRYQVGTVTAEGVTIEGPIKVTSDWQMAHMVKGYE